MHPPAGGGEMTTIAYERLRAAWNAFCGGKDLDANDAFTFAAGFAAGMETVVEKLKPDPIGYCAEGDRCVCGGDLPRIREGCGNWRKS